MRVNLTSEEFTQIEIPAGTVQNLSPVAAIEIVTTETENSGLVLYPKQKMTYSDGTTIYARSVWDTVTDSDEDVVLAVEPIVSAGGGGGGGGGGMTTIAIGSTTTGAPGTNAIVTNSGTALSAILNFTIPRGASGADGRSFTISGLYPTYVDMVTANPNPTAGEAHFVGTTDENTVWFWDTDKEPANWTDAGPLKGLKGDPGTNGAAATVTVGSVSIGTPVSVTNSGTSNAAVLDFVIPPGTGSDWFYLRRNNATYAEGDIAYSLLLPSWLCLQCTQGGTTGATEPNYVATAGTYVNDGTAIWIIKVVNGWQSYSTTEQVVGTWIDGKPLYQKTIQTTLPSTAATSTVIYEFTDIKPDVMVELCGFAIDDNGTTRRAFYPINSAQEGSEYIECYFKNYYDLATNAKIVSRVDSIWTDKPVYITIKYTKTTD